MLIPEVQKTFITVVLFGLAGCADHDAAPLHDRGGKNDDVATFKMRGEMPGDSLQITPDLGTEQLVHIDLDGGEFGEIDALTFSVYFVDPDTGGPRAEPVTPNVHVSVHRARFPNDAAASWESDDTDTSWSQQFTPKTPESGEWSFMVKLLGAEPLPVMLDVRTDSPGWRAREVVDFPEVEPNNIDLGQVKNFSVADWKKNCQNFDVAGQPFEKNHFAFRGTLKDKNDVDCYLIDPHRPDILAQILEPDDQLDLLQCGTNGVCTEAIGTPRKRATMFGAAIFGSDHVEAFVVRSRDGKQHSYSLMLDELSEEDGDVPLP
jgi:hypothetical protein